MQKQQEMKTNSNQSSEEFIEFICREKTKLSVPLSFLNRYPKSIFAITYRVFKKKQADKHTFNIYYPDSLLQHVFLILNHELSIDSSIPLKDLCDIYEIIIEYGGPEALSFKISIFECLVNILCDFLEKNNCQVDRESLYNPEKGCKIAKYNPFTDETINSFRKHSLLFNFFNVNEVILKTYFFEDIPQEYIYPTEILDIFPKLEDYWISLSFLYEKTCIQITPSDPHYNSLYKEYKRQYYKKNYPRSYVNFIELNDAYQRNHLKPNHVSLDINVSYNNDNDDTDSDYDDCLVRNLPVAANDHITIDIDKEIENEKHKPVLYIPEISNYSRNYSELSFLFLRTKERNDPACLSSCIFNIYFTGFDKGIPYLRNISHPIFKQVQGEDYEVLKYILQIPVCKQLRLASGLYNPPLRLQVHTPSILRALNEGLLDSIQYICILNYIQYGAYPEHIEFFKNILTTHVFPNVTTLIITGHGYDDTNLLFQTSFLPYITRKNFPQLHIYDLRDYIYNTDNDVMEYLSTDIFQESFLQLIDSIEITDNEYTISKLYFPDSIFEKLVNINKQHKIVIYSPFAVNQYYSFTKSLFDSGAMYIEKLAFEFKHMMQMDTDYSDLNLTDFSALKPVLTYYKLIKGIQCDRLEALYCDFYYKSCDNFASVLSDYFKFMCCHKYDTVTYLNISLKDAFGDRVVHPTEEILNIHSTCIYDFMKLFSSKVEHLSLDLSSNIIQTSSTLMKCLKLPLWKGLKHLELSTNKIIDEIDLFKLLAALITSEKFYQLETLKVSYDGDNYDLEPLLLFMDLMKSNNIMSLLHLNTFYIFIMIGNAMSNMHSIKNIIPSFPSLYCCMNKEQKIFRMDPFLYRMNHFKEYCDYIYESLSCSYTTHMKIIEIYAKDNVFMMNIVHLISSGHFICLEEVIFHVDKSLNYYRYLTTLYTYMKKTKKRFRILIKDLDEA
ncbi:hypothetical protein WA158_005302 [Blastocystis sp. Blastoise]